MPNSSVLMFLIYYPLIHFRSNSYISVSLYIYIGAGTSYGAYEDMSEYSSKFSPGVKLFLSELKTGENPYVSIIIRTINSLETEHKSQLKVIGAEIRTIAGDIVTLSLLARKLPILAKNDYVKYIELTRPLYPEYK